MSTRTLGITLALVLAQFSTHVAAEKPENMATHELSLLPQWCNDTMGFAGYRASTRTYDAYVQRYGRGWSSMHHYCWAMIDQMRLMRTLADKRRRDYMVERVVGNLDYVINNSDTDFAFRPEIFQRRATVLRLGGRNDEALRTLRQWVDEWPKMPAAHVALIELLLTLGRKESAREAYSNALQTLEERDTLLPYAARVGAQ